MYFHCISDQILFLLQTFWWVTIFTINFLMNHYFCCKLSDESLFLLQTFWWITVFTTNFLMNFYFHYKLSDEFLFSLWTLWWITIFTTNPQMNHHFHDKHWWITDFATDSRFYYQVICFLWHFLYDPFWQHCVTCISALKGEDWSGACRQNWWQPQLQILRERGSYENNI